MNIPLNTFITKLETANISALRKATLQPLIDFIEQKRHNHETIRLNFICTHNSRRSHLSQIWAQTMASFFKIENVFCYSGGTEATALFPKITETLQNVGFTIEKIAEGKNPIYSVKYSENEHPIIGFSKTIESTFNPKSKFAAIMTCSHADENCPIITGTEKRVSITYEDPKVFDNTDKQAEKYRERSEQIATEMKYVFSKVNN
jgi:arsenate reductase